MTVSYLLIEPLPTAVSKFRFQLLICTVGTGSRKWGLDGDGVYHDVWDWRPASECRSNYIVYNMSLYIAFQPIGVCLYNQGCNRCCLEGWDLPSPTHEPVGKRLISHLDLHEDRVSGPLPGFRPFFVVSSVCLEPCQIIHCVRWINTVQGVFRSVWCLSLIHFILLYVYLYILHAVLIN